MAFAVARDVERRDAARSQAEARVRDVVVEFGKTIFASFFADLDFARLSLRQLFEKEFWALAVDAYITDFATDVAGTVLSGDIGINPLGAYDDESAEFRTRNLDLLVAAYDSENVQRRGDVIAIPLHSRSDGARQKWGAAYIRLAIPALPALPRGTDVSTVAIILAVATLVVVLFVFLLLHLLVLNPLSRISDAAARVSTGRYDVPVESTGRDDEIDELIASFNAMMAEIGQKREALESRVEDMVAKMRLTEQRLVLTDRLAAMGTLAAGIAHEINNPLGGMLNAVQSIRRRGGLPERTERYLALIEDGLGRIRDVTQRVLRFSPGRGGTGTAVLREVVEDAVRFSKHRLDRSKARLEIDVDPELRVRGDPAALGQVFLNLALNALDALGSHDGRERVIRITGRRVGDGVHVVVADTGAGMTDQERSQAFNLFFTTKEAGKGTGLGLSIVHQIVTEHGGSIEIESEAGEGTEIHIHLPSV